jgi:hypothetical protein
MSRILTENNDWNDAGLRPDLLRGKVVPCVVPLSMGDRPCHGLPDLGARCSRRPLVPAAADAQCR